MTCDLQITLDLWMEVQLSPAQPHARIDMTYSVNNYYESVTYRLGPYH
jgi:hypothetical protein